MLREIGREVAYDKEPLVVSKYIMSEHRAGLKYYLERTHNIALLYRCRVPDGYVIDNKGRIEGDEGFLKWFDEFPEIFWNAISVKLMD